jgi:hypothetical protein
MFSELEMDFSRGSTTEAGVAKVPNSGDVDTFAPAARFGR